MTDIKANRYVEETGNLFISLISKLVNLELNAQGQVFESKPPEYWEDILYLILEEHSVKMIDRLKDEVKHAVEEALKEDK